MSDSVSAPTGSHVPCAPLSPSLEGGTVGTGHRHAVRTAGDWFGDLFKRERGQSGTGVGTGSENPLGDKIGDRFRRAFTSVTPRSVTRRYAPRARNGRVAGVAGGGHG